MKFSALVLTHNEETNIARCLKSLRPADRIVVIDSGSEDRTLEIIRRFPSVKIVRRPFQNFSDQRNYGLRHCFPAQRWVLHLDADEVLTRRLAREIASLSPAADTQAFNLAPMTYFRGKPIPRAAGFPIYQTRLTRRSFRFVEVGHGQKAPPELGAIPRLKNFYEHHPFDKGLSDWLARHDRYSTLEAREWIENKHHYTLSQALRDPIACRQWLKQMLRNTPAAPSLSWAFLMFWKGGVLDGPAGWDYCRLRYFYEFMVSLKKKENSH